jgi:hypothetical protein
MIRNTILNTAIKKYKTYLAEVKIGDRANGSPIMKVWHVNNLLSFTSFLNEKYPGWRWFNIKDKQTGVKMASFTRNSPPVSRQLPE